MLRPDRGDDDDVRSCDRAERRDLSGPAHAHLGHEHRRVRLEPADGERQADLVVEARLRPDRRRGSASQRAPRMSFVDVLPVEPTTATTRARLFERTSEASAASAASWSSGTSVLAPRSVASATCVDTRVQGDEEISRADEPGVRLDTRHRLALEGRARRAGALRSLPLRPGSRAEPGRAESLAHDLAIVERSDHATGLLALLVPLAGDHDDVTRRCDRRPRGEWRCGDRDRSRRPFLRPAARPG